MRFEYDIEMIARTDDGAIETVEMLRERGRNGWIMCAAVHGDVYRLFYFYREIVPVVPDVEPIA